MMLELPPNRPTMNFSISLAVHFVLFFLTTVGRWQEKLFLFLSYASIYTSFSIFYSVFSYRVTAKIAEIILPIALILIMQLLLYQMLLPGFRKVTPYIRRGWGKYYTVVLGFFALIASQSVFPLMTPMTDRQIAVFLLTTLVFCTTYVTIFVSMKNMVELSREKQKQTHAELLLMQVQSQAKEAELIRQYRHDMRHHCQMLLSYAESGDLENLTDYLKHHTEHIEAISTSRYCENETVNNILKVYNRKATEQNISIEVRAAAKPNLSIQAPDLVAIIANVLENALHGAAESKSSSPFILVNTKHKSGSFVVNCENSCSKTLDFVEMPEYLKGIGIQSITSTVDKYGGSCRFSAKDGVFQCIVIMDE